METIRISEAEAAADFAGLMARVREGAEVVIESDAQPVAVLRPAAVELKPRMLSESDAQARRQALELGHQPRMGSDFASDLEAIIDSRAHWNLPEWE